MNTLTLPGLIDPHVHLRYGDPHKEDFLTGAQAALAGGFVTVLDMPNNNPPITTLHRLQKKMADAKHLTSFDVGFHFGSLGDNLDEFERVKDLVFGLKLYLNVTTGGYIIDEPAVRRIYAAWQQATDGKKPILLHAEADVMSYVSKIIAETKQPTHICHVSSEAELVDVLRLKEKGLPVTCGVTPHHLFLSQEDEAKLGPYGLMKPGLKSKSDVQFLWNHLDGVDIIETDHAPHTKQEKEGTKPPYGVPGLETALPLMLGAVAEGKITKDRIVELMHTNPARIFHVPTDASSKVEVELGDFTIRNQDIKSKCGWTPFDGRKVAGKVKRVWLHGELAYDHGTYSGVEGSDHITQTGDL